MPETPSQFHSFHTFWDVFVEILFQLNYFFSCPILPYSSSIAFYQENTSQYVLYTNLPIKVCPPGWGKRKKKTCFPGCQIGFYRNSQKMLEIEV